MGRKQRPPSQRSSTTSRSSNPHCNPNESAPLVPSLVRSGYPPRPAPTPPPRVLSSSSLHRGADRAFDQLKRSTITWFSVFLFFGLFSFLLSCPLLLLLSPSSPPPASPFPSRDLIVRFSSSLLAFSPRCSSVWRKGTRRHAKDFRDLVPGR